MNSTGIRRILVALDASEPGYGALQSAAMLANQLHAELQAMFVEDINLLRLAELPFAREMVFGSHEGRRITLANMERQIQQQTARLRAIVEELATQQHINVDFKVLRGHISEELCLAAQQMDLLILGKKNTRQLQQAPKLGRITHDVLSTLSCNVLLLQQGAVVERPVAVLFDGSVAGQRALQLALQLAHGDHDQLLLIYPATGEQQRQVWLQQAVTLSREFGVDAAWRMLDSNSSDALLQTLMQNNSRVLILAAVNRNFAAEAVQDIIQRSPVPVIVVR